MTTTRECTLRIMNPDGHRIRRYATEAAARKAALNLVGSRITLFHEPTLNAGGHFLGHLR